MNPEIDWQVQQKCLTERAVYILKTSLWTDCKFVVGTDEAKKEFAAHKLILAMASPVFEKMFQNCFNETKNDIIIVDIQPEAFGSMLNYVYGDEIDLRSFDQACELCYVANKYMMPNLLKHCTEYIWQDVNISNACRGYEFAKLFDQCDLMAKCKEIICENTSKIIAQASFCDVEFSTMKMILEEDKLAIVSEVELFGAIEKWSAAEYCRLGNCGAECNDKQKIINDELVLKIRFLSMTPEEFAEGPALSPLLTKDQSFGILMNLTSRNCEYPLPQGFSTLKRDISSVEEPENGVSLKLDLCNFTSTDTSCLSTCWISLSCNKDVNIWGFKIAGQLHPYQRSRRPERFWSCSNQYNESVTLTMRDNTSGETKTVDFQSAVEYRCMADVKFPSPVRMFNGRTYVVTIQMNKPGLYMTGSVQHQELLYTKVLFKILQFSDTQFIHGIIFSC